jgi:Pentapeptide repeats (9 copies)
MAEESPVLLPPAEESIEAETEPALEPEPESGESTLEPSSEPGFVCDCEPLMHSACAGLPFYNRHEGKRYCILHYPSTEKSEGFYPAFNRKINAEDFDFRGVFFPGYVSFSDHQFNHRAVFISATFSGEADFSRATFKEEAYFSKATFCAEVLFREATFEAKADFFSVRFTREANLASVSFVGVADFSQAVFLR